jgi:hypothetical protein
MGKLVTFIKDGVVPIVTVATAIMVALLQNSVSKVQNQFRQSELKMKEFEQMRIERESFQAFNLKIYDAVKNSLESKASAQEQAAMQQVAVALVIAMPVDTSLRAGLLNVLMQSNQTDQSVKAQITKLVKSEQSFRDEEADLGEENKSADWKAWNYDIFWCETSGRTAMEKADMIKSAMERNGLSGRLRVRMLPSSINLRAGYQINGFEIRHNIWEKEQSISLQALVEKMLPDHKFRLRTVSQNTPNYMSIFICP